MLPIGRVVLNGKAIEEPTEVHESSTAATGSDVYHTASTRASNAQGGDGVDSAHTDGIVEWVRKLGLVASTIAALLLHSS